jgi:2-polyprenyl-6-hydroxyphenyl methylase / 3-demethylubiquinone-9 3-methyltransferase
MGFMQNVDPAEVAKFSALAAKWWDKESEFRPLHEINPLRLAWIQEKVRLEGLHVLDVGCGGGILSEAMARSGASVHGIDLAEKSLAVARLHQLECAQEIGGPLVYEAVSVEDLAARAPESFDVITCLEMLEHVPDPESVVRACERLVKPGGWVFFSTLNRNPKAFLYAVVGAEYVLNLLPKGTHDLEKFIKPSELAGACRRAGLQLHSMTGLHYNPMSKVYWLESSDVSVNYLMAVRKASLA